MRVLLVQPDQNRKMGFQQLARVEPLGLEMIAGALWSRHEVAILDLRLLPDGLARALSDLQPDLVGISASFTLDLYRALDVARAAKAANPQTFVFVGGHHPSLRPEDFADPAVDAIVVGEGELSTSELADTLAAGGDLDRVLGLVLNGSGGQRFTGQRPLLKDLDTLPFPVRALYRGRRADYSYVLVRPVALVESTRGCPHRCRFCSVWPFYQGRVRYKSPGRVVREVEAVEETHVSFTDDNFLSNGGRALEIARLIRERGIQKRYSFQARSDDVVRRPDVIGEWRKLGLDHVFIGFEKPSQNGLEAVNKHNLVTNNEDALAILRAVGIEPIASFISDPSDGHEEFAALRAYLRRLKLWVPFFCVLTPLPGSALFEETKDNLTTTNYEFYDLAHAVTPTRLQPEEFYREFAQVWRQAYPWWKMQFVRFTLSLRDLIQRKPGAAPWRTVLTEISQRRNAKVYMQDWRQAADRASDQDA